jgi:hypothetical protein
MTVPDKEFRKLMERVKLLEGSPDSQAADAAPVQAKQPTMAILSVAAIVLTLVAGFVGATHTIDNEIDGKFEPLNTRLTKAESAIKTLASQQSTQTQNLVHDLLASAITKPEPRDSQRILAATTSLVTTLKREKSPANPEFFQDGIKSLDQIDRTAGHTFSTFATRVALAEYRSVLQNSPSIDPALARIPIGPGIITQDMVSGRGVYLVREELTVPPNKLLFSDGAVLNGSEIPEGASLLNPSTKFAAKNMDVVAGLIIFARNQALDGITWKNVTFVNTHIIYTGGDLNLVNVKFVNCTFDSPATPHGVSFIQYAALLEPSLSIAG